MKARPKGYPDRVVHFSPAGVLGNVRRHPLGVGLHVICLGWFPKAQGHGIERPNGLDECILIFCTKGKGWLEIEGDTVAVRAGEVLIIPPNKAHSYHADENDPWSIHWAHFSGTSAASYASMLPAHEYVLTVTESDSQDIAKMFRGCYRLMSGGLTEKTLLLVSHIMRHVLGVLFFQSGRSLSGSTGGGFLWESESTDRGCTWSEAAATASLIPTERKRRMARSSYPTTTTETRTGRSYWPALPRQMYWRGAVSRQVPVYGRSSASPTSLPWPRGWRKKANSRKPNEA
jgi:hypothetical protein